jgi:hypothetical protein
VAQAKRDAQAAGIAKAKAKAIRISAFKAIYDLRLKAQPSAIDAEAERAFTESLTPERLATYRPRVEFGKATEQTGELRWQADRAEVRAIAAREKLNLARFEVAFDADFNDGSYTAALATAEAYLTAFRGISQLSTAHLGAAVALLALDRPVEAVNRCTRVLALCPGDSSILNMRAIAYESAGRLANATADRNAAAGRNKPR